MKKQQATVQIGKNGITEGTIALIRTAFVNRENIKIHVLKSGGHEREKIKQMAEELTNSLGKNYTYKMLGFCIFIKKWKKPKR